MTPAPTFIDLFSGCGGFTLGMLRAGFNCLGTVDNNAQAVATLRRNLVDRDLSGCSRVGVALERDLTEYTPADFSMETGIRSVDVIVGGPPCQGFSTARQADGANHGRRLKDDPRRHLYRKFLDYVDYFQPSVFVIENVLGLKTAADGKFFTAVQHESRVLGMDRGRPGYRVHAQSENAEEFGVPQKRRRLLIIGVRADLTGYFSRNMIMSSRAMLGTTLGDAILDLPPIEAGGGAFEMDYDATLRRRVQSHRGVLAENYLQNVLEVWKSDRIMNHEARAHSDRDLGDFRRIGEGQSSALLMRAGVEFDFPYDKNSFQDRYTRQSREKPCSTITAHLSKDGLMFIHPTQDRSLTPREAARIQSFPDWYAFPEARTHAFRLIGNAVPPLISESVGLTLKSLLAGMSPLEHESRMRFLLPSSLNNYVARSPGVLRHESDEALLDGWRDLLELFPDLHPMNAMEAGPECIEWPDGRLLFPHLDDSLLKRDLRTGWPLPFRELGVEMWRRSSSAGSSISLDDLFVFPSASNPKPQAILAI